MREILTRKGQVILVDDEDFEELNALTWHIDGSTGYVARNVRGSDGRRRKEYMHRRLMGLAPGDKRLVDHENENKADNRRSTNLRVCTKSQNMCNRGATRRNKAGIKGVHWSEERRKWVAAIRYRGKQKILGRFETAELAQEMYCLAADMLQGEFAHRGAA